MSGSAGVVTLAKKKSAPSKYGTMTRIDQNALERGRLAASMMGISMAEWLTATLVEAAERDIRREAAKIVSEDPKAKRKPTDT